MDRDVFASRIIETRLSFGLSQVEFAQMCGVSRHSVIAWEAGTRFPQFPTLRKIAAATGRPAGWFFGIEDAPPAPVAVGA